MQSLVETWKGINKVLNKKRYRIIEEPNLTALSTFKVGDKVMVSTQNFSRSDSKKLTQRWAGPFEVIAEVGNGAFRVRLAPGLTHHNVFHSGLLKPYKSRKDAVPSTNGN